MERTFWQWIALLLKDFGALYLRGTLVTVELAVIGTLIGFVIGMLIGIVRAIPIRRGGESGFSFRTVFLKIVNFILSAYVEIFRGTPMMVQAVLIYYGLTEAYNIFIPAIAAGIIVISLNTGAYMAEVVRGGIHSVPLGQSEAAKALGMTHWKTMFHVVLPQAVRNILPGTANEFIANIKDSSVLNVITVGELFRANRAVQGIHYRVYESYFITAVIYLTLTFTFSRLLRLLEKRLDGPENFSLTSTVTLNPLQRHGGGNPGA